MFSSRTVYVLKLLQVAGLERAGEQVALADGHG